MFVLLVTFLVSTTEPADPSSRVEDEVVLMPITPEEVRANNEGPRGNQLICTVVSMQHVSGK